MIYNVFLRGLHDEAVQQLMAYLGALDPRALNVAVRADPPGVEGDLWKIFIIDKREATFADVN